jgi:hypothetical protein
VIVCPRRGAGRRAVASRFTAETLASRFFLSSGVR